MKTIKITKGNVSKKVQQFNLENLNHLRANINGIGWSDIKVDETFYNDSINEVVDLLGGLDATKAKIKFKLRNEPVNGWFMQRLVFEPLRNKWVYIAGQDYPSELKEIRKQLSK